MSEVVEQYTTTAGTKMKKKKDSLGRTYHTKEGQGKITENAFNGGKASKSPWSKEEDRETSFFDDEGKYSYVETRYNERGVRIENWDFNQRAEQVEERVKEFPEYDKVYVRIVHKRERTDGTVIDDVTNTKVVNQTSHRKLKTDFLGKCGEMMNRVINGDYEKIYIISTDVVLFKK